MELRLNPSPPPSNYGLIEMTSDRDFWHKHKNGGCGVLYALVQEAEIPDSGSAIN